MNFFHEHHGNTQVIRSQKIQFEPHLHYEIEIIVLFKGSTTAMLNGKEYQVSEGDFVIIFPNIIHNYKEGEGVDVGKIIFSPDKIPELKEIFKAGVPQNPVIKNAVYEVSLTKEILDSYDGSSSAVQKAYLLLLAGKLIEHIKISPRQSNDFSALNAILDYCQENFKTKLTEKDVAKALHLSDSYLSHIFSGKMGINFCRYVNTLRINEACSLLSGSDTSVTEIAEECGFGSLRSFNRVFFEHQGLTPREYRKRCNIK